MATDRLELLYIFDPLCGWCYGTSPVIERLADEFADRVSVTVLSGGMITGEEAGPIRQMWPYIQQASQQVAGVTGAEFGAAFQELGEAGAYHLDSEPPSRALTVFKQLDPLEREAAFAHALQRAHFAEGQDLNDPATYAALARAFSLDADEFLRWWDNDASRQATQHEFDVVQRLGVQGFPTLVLAHGSQGYVLARGYQPYEQLKAGLEELLRTIDAPSR
ncbi:DsbA family protein [Hymenobacter sp. 15J16-1T3B]|uniref:DsbA family protein n=1 Tax=Hymenobacter sp. 15J16-1T3B TaxID=2886941 RepID=UPI001D11DC6E|nr:DsbA family protein [Hymenobacter sp. 15J16-1T3B]MCC3157187.1 DsbA family protein [Hymenobacter sp. 15J16-1T3B]